MGNKNPISEYDLDVVLVSKGLINVFMLLKMDPHNAYSIQFGDNDKVRLYRLWEIPLLRQKYEW